MSDALKPKSDLKVRTLSAIVMVAIAGAALWVGGLPFTLFAIAVGLGVIWEWWGLVVKISTQPILRAIWLVFGTVYVGLAVHTLINFRSISLYAAAFPIVLVAAIDIGAYFAGRTIGGPKIAPSISPSKTWAGLLGGALAATVMFVLDDLRSESLDIPFPGPISEDWSGALPFAILLALVVAVVAQSGDFFESWMKRRAGVKDSGCLIPGHGGLFDRIDGLMALLSFTAIVDGLTLT